MKHSGVVWGGNLLWLAPMSCITPHVPVIEERVAEIMELHMPFPRQAPFMYDVAVDWQTKPKPPYGNFILVSPPETLDAVLWKVATRIDAGADAEEMLAWRRTLQSVQMRFLKLDSDDDKHYHMLQMREDKKGEGQSVRLNTIQECLDIYGFKTRKELGQPGLHLSAKCAAALYKEHVRFAPGTRREVTRHD